MRINTPPPVRITQQVLERQSTTYELECAGLPLAIRIFLPVGDPPTNAWRIDVSGADVVVSASAASRALALELAIERWRGSAPSVAYKALDWQAIGAAMTAVRAL